MDPRSNNPMRLDSNESAFFDRELLYVKTKAYDAKLAELKGLSLIPISTEAGSGVNEIAYQQYRGVGFAKIIADYVFRISFIKQFNMNSCIKKCLLTKSYRKCFIIVYISFGKYFRISLKGYNSSCLSSGSCFCKLCYLISSFKTLTVYSFSVTHLNLCPL